MVINGSVFELDKSGALYLVGLGLVLLYDEFNSVQTPFYRPVFQP